MSNEDPYRPNQGRDRGAYTPPTDDDLPFNRGGYDARRAGGGGGGAKAPPMTLIISGAVLLLLIIAVVVYYRAGPRSSNDAPRASPAGEPSRLAPAVAARRARRVRPPEVVELLDRRVPRRGQDHLRARRVPAVPGR